MGSAAFNLSVGQVVWSEHHQPNGPTEEVYGEKIGVAWFLVSRVPAS